MKKITGIPEKKCDHCGRSTSMYSMVTVVEPDYGQPKTSIPKTFYFCSTSCTVLGIAKHLRVSITVR